MVRIYSDLLMIKRIILILLIFVAAGLGVWTGIRFARPAWQKLHGVQSAAVEPTHVVSWYEAVEQVKEDRSESAGNNIRVETPPELKHYDERHWFLATQVAEVAKHKIHNCQDYMDLAGMIQRGEMVTVPAVTNSYVLFGIGERADDDPFSRYEDDHSIELYDHAQLTEAYKQIDEKRARLQSEIASLNSQSTKLSKRERTKQRELQKQVSALQEELSSTNEDKARLDEFYGHDQSRNKLFGDYASLQELAKNFGGRSYDINNASDRQALKVHLLSSLRPPALKIMEEVASAYHRQFNRRLPVSSLVRPEQYQRALRRVNRNAVLIETPPHSTGLAFDIDYRYMPAAEQSFVMGELARIKREGRIEVIRERNANYHVFAFIDGTRPNDELITASLEEARGPAAQQAHHAQEKPKKSRPARATQRQSRKRRR